MLLASIARPHLRVPNTDAANALSIWNKIVGWWEMDEPSGTTMIDSHTNALNGLYGSGPVTLNQTPVAANLVKSVNFSGAVTLQNTAQVANTAALNVTTGDFCQFVWVKPDTSGTGIFPWLMAKPSTNNGKSNYALFWSTQFWFRVTISGTNHDVGGTTSIVNATPYMVLGQRSGSTGLELWVNAALEGTGTLAAAQTLDTATNPLTWAYEAFGAAGSNYKGNMDQTAFFNAALTSAEIAYLYNGGAGRTYAVVKAQSGH